MTASVFTNHKAIYIGDDPEYGLWTFKGKFANLPCRIHLRQPVQTVQLLAKFRNKLTWKTIAFAIPNENDEGKRTNLHTCPDDQALTPSENSPTSDNVVADSDTYISKSESGFFQRIDHSGIQASLQDKLKAIHLHVLASEKWNASRLKLSHRNYKESATNLIHYLALKCLDTEPLTDDLVLSSLLNLETVNSSVLDCLATGIQLLENVQLNSVRKVENGSTGVCMQEKLDQEKKENFTLNKMRKKVCLNRERLLGWLQGNRMTHIMTTVGEEALERETLIADMIKAGTSVIRINCAHGNPGIWSEIIRRAKQSSQMLEAPCRILMDLAGPKLRTNNLKPGPRVVKISPKRNASGNVIFPAQVWVSHKGSGSPPSHVSPDAVLFIDDQNFFTEIKVGDTLRFVDARDKKKMLKVSEVFHTFSGTGFIAECARTAYVSSGTELYVKRKKSRLTVGKVVDVPATESFIRLRVGELLTISRNGTCDLDNSDSDRYTNSAHRIACSSGYLFDAVKPGDRIAFDDGKIWGVIKGTSNSEIVVSITHAGPGGTKLGSQKSINIPDSDIQFEGLTSKDLVDLEFVASHADMVGISFVRDTRDIIVLRQELEKRKLKNLGIVLKIETQSGFEKLPHLLLETMKSPNPLGVMIARGDLAVECGWERLADIQEEILSVSGAAHVPVIWATQVLESLVKSGVPTRAEITDVANGKRASCIMLNKGKHIVQAVSVLNNILHANSNQTKAKLKSLVLSSHLS